MRAAFWYVRQIMRTAPPAGGIAIETFPRPGMTADITVDCFIAHNAATEFHPTGMCSTMPLALGGMVDTGLVVYETKNVCVVDMSVVPDRVG
ncbi:hypothetical protein DFH08DRAFT_900752 [Mycena albidolilacea]|uniref:Glucose-methanol-choline oxidoreductase C-terminal domain-containing protein n=1 Tax=Mycena albidolilacea TaxID=1033008 RepID=A0AAD6Z505_9AGAR|nr:hypothetical protein DFH08DRAFT_900752 [Mycena albidolilacea]